MTSSSPPPRLAPSEVWVVATILVLFGFLTAITFSRSSHSPSAIDITEPTQPQPITVVIEGAVAHPGAYVLSKGDTLEALLVKAAPLPTADLSKLAFDRPLRNRQRLYIPVKGEKSSKSRKKQKQETPFREPSQAVLPFLDKLGRGL